MATLPTEIYALLRELRGSHLTPEEQLWLEHLIAVVVDSARYCQSEKETR